MYIIATGSLDTKTAPASYWPNRYPNGIKSGAATAPGMFLMFLGY